MDLTADTQAVRELYESVEGEVFALIFGEQIHVGGFDGSLALADAAGINGGEGVELCCGTGAGMRFLVRYRQVESMVGVELASAVVQRGRARCEEEGLAQVTFLNEDACHSGIAAESADFVWSEDAWCYVPDKPRLIREAARIVRRGGTIAFTDWVEGVGLEAGERELLSAAMKITNLVSRAGYAQLLEENGCEVLVEESTGLFEKQVALIAEMLDSQYKWDALKLLSFDADRVALLVQGLRMLADWGGAGKLEQARIVARRAT